jgi:hypothetical protein
MADRKELRTIFRRSGIFFDGEDCYGFRDRGGIPLHDCEDFWQLLEDCYDAGVNYGFDVGARIQVTEKGGRAGDDG